MHFKLKITEWWTYIYHIPCILRRMLSITFSSYFVEDDLPESHFQGLTKFASSSKHRLKCFGSVVDKKPETKRKRKWFMTWKIFLFTSWEESSVTRWIVQSQLLSRKRLHSYVWSAQTCSLNFVDILLQAKRIIFLDKPMKINIKTLNSLLAPTLQGQS